MTWGLSRRSRALRHSWCVLGAVLAGALSACPVMAKEVARATGNASAVVVAPLSLIKVTDMNFAKVAPRATAGTIVLSPVTGACTTPDGMIRSGTCVAASFAGMGRRNLFVRITYPTTLNLTGPGQAMLVDTFTLNTSVDLISSPIGNGNGNGSRRYIIASLSGIYTFKMGGTLHVNANQAPGIYTGTYTVTVQYN